MKKNFPKNDYMNMYSNEYNSIDLDPNENNNDNLNKIRKDDSLDKYFNPIEESHESEDILKKLDNLNFSEETSFEMPQKIFEPLAQNNSNPININNKKNNEKNKNEKLSKYDLISDNNNNKEENKNDLYYNSYNNPINEENYKENDSNGQLNNNIITKKEITEITLKEKLNSICLSLQGYTLKPKCYENLNNFIPCLTKISKELYQPFDLVLDVFIELLYRMKEEFNVKENLIQKLNNISVINDGYDKKILKLKKEIKDKDKEIGSLINKITFEKDKIKDNSKSKILEINSLKKENNTQNNSINIYKNKKKKINTDNKY